MVETFADLLAGSTPREVRAPGTRVETGSLRVVTPGGEPVGFYVGNERTGQGEDFAELVERSPPVD